MQGLGVWKRMEETEKVKEVIRREGRGKQEGRIGGYLVLSLIYDATQRGSSECGKSNKIMYKRIDFVVITD